MGRLQRPSRSAGWNAIVETLFTGIDALLNDDQAKRFRVEQVEEKFGILRLYLSFDRIDADGVNPNPDALRSLVDAAVAASEVTCSVCGALGEMRNLGWANVRCDAHANREVESTFSSHRTFEMGP